MYKPIQPGIESKFKHSVLYNEQRPQQANADAVYCLWELRTLNTLRDSFSYLILPDVCIDIVFDVSLKPTFSDALIMTPSITATTINLGKEFSYVGIRFLPGAWHKKSQHIAGRQDFVSTLATQDMTHFSRQLSDKSNFSQQIILLEQLVSICKDTGAIRANGWLQRLLANFEHIHTVDDISKITGYSRRHLQRIFKEQAGYNPHDFLKIIRFQQAFIKKSPNTYTDQSHYIHQFKDITGVTPKTFQKIYMSQIYNTKPPANSKLIS